MTKVITFDSYKLMARAIKEEAYKVINKHQDFFNNTLNECLTQAADEFDETISIKQVALVAIRHARTSLPDFMEDYNKHPGAYRKCLLEYYKQQMSDAGYWDGYDLSGKEDTYSLRIN